MTSPDPAPTPDETQVTPVTPATPAAAGIRVRYWAAARQAAGVEYDEVPTEAPISLAEVLARAVARHPGTRLPDVLQICSVLLGDRPVTADDPGEVMVPPGATVEFLPPFAGG